ncbi:FMN-dependent oxidoreductase (nitrilotriacetate monooxygenase family) [Allocatelliglobosispora scoriae]|uniref:FMN-dependent oxidoreductase (Nitrilotriacetate monooxygenase family) n=1 Tax=Allocatelliglobosispora scoriae TaxID=643052 RepID=A0A841BN06_9ACTN|nr:LLM class flavin-dependent oxidoreductase [Allocatelliglobosispora scoriae]MBB5868221.1 FMN-dependent oxidoreductase (nitrilotriacetate monooxygenase family) [Allocatelliglobosispora scoriae]
MSIGMNILGLGGHSSAWRYAEVDPMSYIDIDYYRNIGRISERGTLDAIFLADGPALAGNPAGGPAGRLEPTLVLTAIALATERIGVIATASTSYNSPYNLARRIASLDHISGGRAAWNVVTTAGDAAARNFGLTGAPIHDDRYGRAEEFVEIAVKLWDSWEDDAIIADRERGVFADAAKVHSIDHVGTHFSVRGPMNIPRSPQGRPVLVQAGSSEQGKSLGARHADAIFTTQTTLEDGQAFYSEMRARAAAFGRDPDSIKIMPGLSTVIGSTEAEALARQAELDDIQGFESQLSQMAQRLQLDPKDLDVDSELPWHLIGEVGRVENGSHGFFEAQINLARREKLTVRQLSGRIRSGHRLVAGSPEQIADTLEEWFRKGAADGFNIMPDMFPSGAEIFVDHVVPELRRRGVFRTEYTGTTLRDHLGLSRPASQYA